MKKIIPGQIRAYDFWLFLLLALIGYLKTGHWFAVGAAFLFVIGLFLAVQTTHLAQMEHASPPPTWLERQQQAHRYIFIAIGTLVAAIGWLMVI